MSVVPAHIERTNPPGVPDVPAYTQVTITEAGRLAFVSGQIARRNLDDTVPATLAEQAAVIRDDIRAILDDLGVSAEHIVMMRIYVVDLTPDKVDEAFPILAEVFSAPAPSVTGIGVTSLAAPEFQIEVELVISLPGARE